MKTNIFNITAIALIISSSFISGRNLSEAKSFEFPSETLSELVELNTTSYTMVEAKIVDGEVIPFVTLPELNIVSEYNKGTMVKTKMVNGELMPVVELPELTIESK